MFPRMIYRILPYSYSNEQDEEKRPDFDGLWKQILPDEEKDYRPSQYYIAKMPPPPTSIMTTTMANL